MATLSPDCKKRMATWVLLAFFLVAVIVVSGYALFESPAQGPGILHRDPAPSTQ